MWLSVESNAKRHVNWRTLFDAEKALKSKAVLGVVSVEFVLDAQTKNPRLTILRVNG